MITQFRISTYSEELSNKIELLFNREELRLLFLFFIACYITYPHLGRYLTAYGGDSQTYFYLVSDFLTQLRHGIYPLPYINQTSFSPMSIPLIAISPLIFFVAGFFDLISCHMLSFGTIFNLTINFPIFFGAFLTYYLLLKIQPSLRWQAALLSALYLLSPGVGGLLYIWKMYFSSMAIPFVPLLFYSIYRCFNKKDYIASCLVGVSLSLLCSAHPPIWFMCINLTILSQLGQLCFQNEKMKTLKIVLCSYLVFLLLSFFYFAAIFGIGRENLGQYSLAKQPVETISTNFFYLVKSMLKSTSQVAFLPSDFNNFRTHRLGMSFWVLLLIAISCNVSIWKKPLLYPKILMGLFLLIGILILPIPVITMSLWYLLVLLHSSNVFQLVSGVPGDRLYVCMAAIGIFLLFLICNEAKLGFKKFFLILCVLGVLYAMWEIHYSMHDEYLLKTKSTIRVKNFTAINSLPENMRTYTMTAYMGPNSEDGFFEPLFENRIVSNQNVELQSLKKALDEKLNLIKADFNLEAKFQAEKDNYKGPSLILEPNKYYAVRFIFKAKHVKDWAIFLEGENFFRQYSSVQRNFREDKFSLLSLWHSEQKTKKIEMTFYGHCEEPFKTCSINMDHFLIHQYDPMSRLFPVHLISAFPYKALLTDIKKDSYFELHKRYIKNYLVTVNGKQTPYTQSHSAGRVLVPIKAGQSIIEVTFIYTNIMIIAFFISFFSWIAVFLFLYYKQQKVPTWAKNKFLGLKLN